MEQVKGFKIAEILVGYKRKHSSVAATIKDSTDAFNCIIKGFDLKTIGMQEQFVVLYINQANLVLGLYKASSGGITGTVADNRIILATGLKLLCTGILLSHNHPSGNLKASVQNQGRKWNL